MIENIIQDLKIKNYSYVPKSFTDYDWKILNKKVKDEFNCTLSTVDFEEEGIEIEQDVLEDFSCSVHLNNQ